MSVGLSLGEEEHCVQECPTADDVDLTSSYLISLGTLFQNVLDAQLQGALLTFSSVSTPIVCMPQPHGYMHAQHAPRIRSVGKPASTTKRGFRLHGENSRSCSNGTRLFYLLWNCRR